jgi:hypothetical protein
VGGVATAAARAGAAAERVAGRAPVVAAAQERAAAREPAAATAGSLPLPAVRRPAAAGGLAAVRRQRRVLAERLPDRTARLVHHVRRQLHDGTR